MHTHCGACAQCLQRRIGTLGAGLADADPEKDYAADMLLGPRESTEDRAMVIDMIRSALEFRRLSETGFLQRYAGEFSRLNTSFPGVSTADAARNFIELFRRHGETVRGVLIEAAKTHAAALVDNSLPPSCLVRIAVDHPDWEPEPRSLEQSHTENEGAKREAAKIDYRRNSEILLAIDTEKKWILIDGITPIKGSSAFRLLSFLTERYQEDRSAGKRRENHKLVTGDKLAELLGLASDAAVRATIYRLRRDLSEEFERRYGLTLPENALIENVYGVGYRINPEARVVAPSEIKPPE
jgi:hypothetical protein